VVPRSILACSNTCLTDPARCVRGDLAPLCATVPVVDPTITAAWITAGVGALGIAGTVITAWIGSRNTRMATERTITAGAATTAATLAAAREDRLWEKRCAAYEETLAELLHRRAKRRYELSEDQLSETAEGWLEGTRDGEVSEAESRLTAYASDAVREAFRLANEAHDKVLIEYLRYRRTADLYKRQVAATHGISDGFKVTVAARKAVDLPASRAEAADDALIAVIRDELRSKPEAATLPATVPAKRHRWPRHRE